MCGRRAERRYQKKRRNKKRQQKLWMKTREADEIRTKTMAEKIITQLQTRECFLFKTSSLVEIEFLMQTMKTGQEGREEGKRNEVSEMKVEKGREIESE